MKQEYTQNNQKTLRSKLLLSLLLVLGWQTYVCGQTNNTNNPINPETLFKNQMVNTPATAALKQNIVYPVNHSTGLPEIKIPLYEVQSGDVTLPIYLTYHASGIKLIDVAGWVGLGWDLVAEPMITRTVQGALDDPRTMTCKFDKNANRTRWPYYVKNLTTNSIEEPDEYYYRLPSKQGTFMYAMEPIDQSQKFLPIPYENIRIDWLDKYFQITDDDGTIYKFNGGKETGNNSIIGWRASAVVAPNQRDSISFVYNDKQTQYLVKTHDDYIIIRDQFSRKKGINTNRRSKLSMTEHLPDECMQDPIIISKLNNTTYGFQCDNKGRISSDGTIPEKSSYEQNIDTRSQQLSEILFNQGKIVFTKDPQYPRLQKFTIYDCNGVFIKEVQFNYMMPNDRITQRYFLESLVITDLSGETNETYRFSYTTPNGMPEPGSRSIDYWGYYNGINRPDSVSLVPKQTIEVTRWKFTTIPDFQYPTGIEPDETIELTLGSELSREPNEKYMEYGTLASITYPAGSTDEFTYEAHRYKDSENNIKQAGGLRVKQIKTTCKNGYVTFRTFTYGRKEDGCGTPLTTNVLNYFRLVQDMLLCELFDGYWKNGVFYYSPMANEYGNARQRTFFSNPTRPITFEGGSSVMYDYVTEYNGTLQNNSGKTVYEYTTDNTHPMPNDMHTMRCNQHDGWKYGQLFRETVYRKDNNQYTPLEETEYTHSILNKEFGRILVGEASVDLIIRESSLNNTPIEAQGRVSYQRTEITPQSKQLTWSRHTIFTNESPISTTTYYEYATPNNIYPTRITEKGNDSIEYIINLVYPHDYKNVYPYTEMVERNILNPIIKKEYTRQNEYIGIETPYTSFAPHIYQPTSIVVHRSVSDKGDIRSTYLYNEWGKIRQVTKDHKENVVYLYGHRNQHIIARIENATYTEVAEKLGGEATVNKIATDKSPYMHNINQLRRLLPTAHVTTYSYIPLVGVASITDPTGLTTYYEYDGLGRLAKTYITNGNKKEMIEKQEYHYANQ